MKLDAPVKHLLVDLDGTLLGNHNIRLSIDFSRQALSAMKKYGGWRKAAQTLLAINQEFRKPSIGELLTNDHRVVALFANRIGIAPEIAREVLRENVSSIFPSLKRHFYPIPGAKDFLDWAKGRYPLILATNPVWTESIIKLRVEWAGIDPSIFEFMTDVRSMRACKPSVDYYLEILKLRNLRAQDCLLVGNELKMDLPATLVGIRVFIVGPFKKLQSVTLPGSKALGWKGSYAHLRALLEGGSGMENG